MLRTVNSLERKDVETIVRECAVLREGTRELFIVPAEVSPGT